MPCKYLFDTNIIIEILNNKGLEFSEKQLEISFLISIITELELFSNINLTSSEETSIK